MKMTRKEFEKSLFEALDFWGRKSKQEVRELLGDDVAEMVGFHQRNPHHCYDLFQHVLHVVEALPKNDSVLLRVAAFFHDIGKPGCAREKQERLVFYGHAAKSAEIAERILDRMGYLEEEKKRILFYISHHDDFISWVLPTDAAGMDMKGKVMLSEEVLKDKVEKTERTNAGILGASVNAIWEELFDLCEADVWAQAEVVMRDGIVVDSKEHKRKKISELRRLLDAITK